MFWGALVLYAAVRYVERRAIGWAMLGATALGCLFLTRELSAIVYGLTLGSYVLFRTGMAVWRSRSNRGLAGDAAAAVVCLALAAPVVSMCQIARSIECLTAPSARRGRGGA